MLRAVAFAAALIVAVPAAAQDWRPLDPENTLVIDTSKGRMVVEMRPELAPKAVERIKLLARERVYDGLQFHRVIRYFVAQTGNPNNQDGGASGHPDLEPEFTFPLPGTAPCAPDALICVSPTRPAPNAVTIVARRADGLSGLVGSVPIEAEDGPRGWRGWAAYCPGVAGMGRQADPASGNSEIFFMRGPARRLDHDYTAWGRVVVGEAIIGELAAGEPPTRPDTMIRVRVASDMPASERPRVEVEDGAALQRRVQSIRAAKGADLSVCDVKPAVRVLP